MNQIIDISQAIQGPRKQLYSLIKLQHVFPFTHVDVEVGFDAQKFEQAIKNSLEVQRQTGRQSDSEDSYDAEMAQALQESLKMIQPSTERQSALKVDESSYLTLKQLPSALLSSPIHPAQFSKSPEVQTCSLEFQQELKQEHKFFEQAVADCQQNRAGERLVAKETKRVFEQKIEDFKKQFDNRFEQKLEYTLKQWEKTSETFYKQKDAFNLRWAGKKSA